MKVTVACVGKLKEKYLVQAVGEYAKRLTPYCKLEFNSINEEKMLDNPSEATRQQVLSKETERLLAVIPPQAYVILLDLAGRQITSPELAETIQSVTLQGHSHLCFVIGGAFGYTDALRHRADFRWCFSKLTFTHQMIRVLLVEQIYRAFKIARGEKYHW